MKTGSLIFWEISDMAVEPSKLVDLGFDAYVPRNDYKSAMCKAIALYKKGTEKISARSETQELAVFGVFQKSTTDNDISVTKEFSFSVNKRSGEVTSDDQDFNSFFETSGLKETYQASKATLNSDQIRTMLSKSIKNEFYGISLKSHGGIYFVAESRVERAKQKYERFFQEFADKAQLRVVAMHDDKGSLEAVEGAASDEVFGDIDSLIASIDKDFKSGTITARKLENDKAEAAKILQKIKAHEGSLRDSLEKVKAKLESVTTALGKVTANVENSLVEPEDFMKMLRGIDNPAPTVDSKLQAAKAKVAKMKAAAAAKTVD